MSKIEKLRVPKQVGAKPKKYAAPAIKKDQKGRSSRAKERELRMREGRLYRVRMQIYAMEKAQRQATISLNELIGFSNEGLPIATSELVHLVFDLVANLVKGMKECPADFSDIFKDFEAVPVLFIDHDEFIDGLRLLSKQLEVGAKSAVRIQRKSNIKLKDPITIYAVNLRNRVVRDLPILEMRTLLGDSSVLECFGQIYAVSDLMEIYNEIRAASREGDDYSARVGLALYIARKHFYAARSIHPLWRSASESKQLRICDRWSSVQAKLKRRFLNLGTDFSELPSEC